MHRGQIIQRKPVPAVLRAVEFALCRSTLSAAMLLTLRLRRAREVRFWTNQFSGHFALGNSSQGRCRKSAFLLSSQQKRKTDKSVCSLNRSNVGSAAANRNSAPSLSYL